jgi:hypothetical protein
MPILRDWLTAEQLAVIDDYLPERLTMANGRRSRTMWQRTKPSEGPTRRRCDGEQRKSRSGWGDQTAAAGRRRATTRCQLVQSGRQRSGNPDSPSQSIGQEGPGSRGSADRYRLECSSACNRLLAAPKTPVGKATLSLSPPVGIVGHHDHHKPDLWRQALPDYLDQLQATCQEAISAYPNTTQTKRAATCHVTLYQTCQTTQR